MDIDRLMPPEAEVSTNNEPLPLLQIDPQPRPYQAYCVTEASSRPTSPDTAIPQPLRPQQSSTKERDIEPLMPPNSFLTWSPATSVEEDGSLAISPRRENDGKEQQETSNPDSPSRHTVLANGNHITRAVTPRGSHPLVGNQPLVYDRTQSQSRMHPSVPSHVAISRAYQIKSLPQHANNADMVFRPLPPLPVETALNLDCEESDVQSHSATALEEELNPISQELERSSRSSYKGHFTTVGYGKEDSVLPLKATIETNDQTRSPRKSVTFQDEPQSHSLRLHNDDLSFRGPETDPGESSRDDAHAQLPSSEELYIPRGMFPEINDDRRAHRRTQPKDAKLKYQFGRRPVVKLDLSPPASPHRISQMSWLQPLEYGTADRKPTNDQFTPLAPSSSFHSLTETQAGPRPPPWISYDNLEMQRRNRGEAREREEAQKYRMALETTSSKSLRKGSESADSFGESLMRREVEEYREQVLALYPDLEFDGSAGKGERDCRCWCVVM